MNTHFGNYWPPSFGWTDRYDPFSHPSVLVDFEFDGVSFGKMNRYAVDRFTAFLTELTPHLPGGLHAGKCGCYNSKSITQSGMRSFHTFGIAIDVNWDDNPMGVENTNMPDHIAHALAVKYGLEWGGDWSSPVDRMHFEIHLSPQDAADNVPQPEGEFVDEKTLRAIIRDELNKGVTVVGMAALDDNDGKPGRDVHNPETLLLGIPNYKRVSAREAEAK